MPSGLSPGAAPQAAPGTKRLVRILWASKHKRTTHTHLTYCVLARVCTAPVRALLRKRTAASSTRSAGAPTGDGARVGVRGGARPAGSGGRRGHGRASAHSAASAVFSVSSGREE